MGAADVGEIRLNITANSKPFDNAMKGIVNTAKKIGGILASAFATKALVSFAKSCIDLGSDLAEVQNVVDVTFGSMSDKVNEYAKNAMTTVGLSETMAKQFTGNYGAMAKAFGFTTDAAYEMSTSLTTLAGDVASFYNLDQETAYTKLKSVFTGETESLKELGVVMSQTALDSFALANGFGKTTSEMTEAEKVSLRYAFVQDRLAAASGDFSRTSGGWANQMRVLNLQFESFKATIGQGLINALTPALQMLNKLLAKIQAVAEAFNKLTEEIFGYSDTDSGTAAVASDMDAAAESTDAMGESLKKASRYLAGFDVMTKVSSSSDSSSATATASGTGTASSSGTTQAVDLSDSTTQVSKFEQVLNSIKKTAQEVGTWIKNRFATPVQQSLEKLKTPVENLKKTFENVFSDIQSLGAPLLSYFQGPFCDYIEATMSYVSTAAAGLLDSLNTIFSDIWNVVVFPLAEKFVTDWLPKLMEAQTGLINFAEQVFVLLKGAFDKVWTDAVKPAMELIVGIITSALDTIFQVWDEYGGPLVEAIQNCLDETSAALQKLWDEVLKPIWDNLIERLSQLWEQHLQPLWAKLCAAFLQISTAVANAWNWLMVCIGMICDEWGPDIVNVVNLVVDKACTGIGVVSDILGGLLDFVVDVFTGNWEGAWDKVKGVFGSLGDFFKGVWISIKDVFENIPQWFESKFKSAWQNVKNVFSSGGKVFAGITSGILGGLKNIINGLIGGINNVIAVPFGGINDALDNIRNISIMGAKPFSGLPTISVPQIPMLANGGYVKANTPQLAMIGDNRHQGEVVSPEDKLLEMAYKAASMAGGDGTQLNRIIALLEQLISIVQDGADIVLMVDGEELARANAKGAMSLKRRYTTTEVEFA